MSQQVKLPRNKQEWLRFIIAGILFLAIAIFYPELTKDSSKSQNELTVSEQIPSGRILIQFVRVVDGDTIIVNYQGQQQRVRYLMIDTPESVKEGVKEQPYGKASSKRNETLLKAAKQVFIEFDKGPRTDDYDRLLAYVYADDILVAKQLLLEGLATVSYVNPPNNSKEKEFRQAQQEAKEQKLNIWSIDNYVKPNGKFNQQ